MNYVSRKVSAEIIGGLKLHILSLTRELEVGEWREANLQTLITQTSILQNISKQN